jgi:hypothetical protein
VAQYVILREERDGSYVAHKPPPTDGHFLVVPRDKSAWEKFKAPKKPTLKESEHGTDPR